ncbi:MAG TPA: hypothetical protein VF903_10805 [Nitrospirota bacterium]
MIYAGNSIQSGIAAAEKNQPALLKLVSEINSMAHKSNLWHLICSFSSSERDGKNVKPEKEHGRAGPWTHGGVLMCSGCVRVFAKTACLPIRHPAGCDQTNADTGLGEAFGPSGCEASEAAINQQEEVRHVKSH